MENPCQSRQFRHRDEVPERDSATSLPKWDHQTAHTDQGDAPCRDKSAASSQDRDPTKIESWNESPKPPSQKDQVIGDSHKPITDSKQEGKGKALGIRTAD